MPDPGDVLLEKLVPDLDERAKEWFNELPNEEKSRALQAWITQHDGFRAEPRTRQSRWHDLQAETIGEIEDQRQYLGGEASQLLPLVCGKEITWSRAREMWREHLSVAQSKRSKRPRKGQVRNTRSRRST
jgi:hypothetical protein